MKAPAPRKPVPRQAVPTKATIAKVAVIGASVTFVTAKLIDVALVGAGISAAVGSAAFAGFMLMQSEHAPLVNGTQYLAIFGQPGVNAKHWPDFTPVAPTPPAEIAEAQSPIAVDTAPVGAIEPPKRVAPPDFELVAAGADHAWVRSGARILSIKPGDTIPDLGKVRAIAWNEGHWTLIGEDGKPMLVVNNPTKAPVPKPMIFGTQKAP
jgi:hypothetical protein